jgi:osmotically-inducible protein OsmY
MQVRSLCLAAVVALAATACQTTQSDTNATADTAAQDMNRADGGSQPGESLHDRVHDALMEQMGPKVNDVGVRVEGTAVYLTGSVRTEADRKQAHDIAHGVRGATSVDISALAVKP